MNAGSSPALTEEELTEFEALRRENEALKIANANLQRRLEEFRAHRSEWEGSGDHYTAEAAACCAAIGDADARAPVLPLYQELHRLRATCDVYAEAMEESRNYFFEMKRLYTEVEPYLRATASDEPHVATNPA